MIYLHISRPTCFTAAEYKLKIKGKQSHTSYWSVRLPSLGHVTGPVGRLIKEYVTQDRSDKRPAVTSTLKISVHCGSVLL